MKIGDLVVRTYGEGRRPMAIIVGWYKYGRPGSLARVMWVGGSRIEEMGIKYLEIVNENR